MIKALNGTDKWNHKIFGLSLVEIERWLVKKLTPAFTSKNQNLYMVGEHKTQVLIWFSVGGGEKNALWVNVKDTKFWIRVQLNPNEKRIASIWSTRNLFLQEKGQKPINRYQFPSPGMGGFTKQKCYVEQNTARFITEEALSDMIKNRVQILNVIRR